MPYLWLSKRKACESSELRSSSGRSGCEIELADLCLESLVKKIGDDPHSGGVADAVVGHQP